MQDCLLRDGLKAYRFPITESTKFTATALNNIQETINRINEWQATEDEGEDGGEDADAEDRNGEDEVDLDSIVPGGVETLINQ